MANRLTPTELLAHSLSTARQNEKKKAHGSRQEEHLLIATVSETDLMHGKLVLIYNQLNQMQIVRNEDKH